MRLLVCSVAALMVIGLVFVGDAAFAQADQAQAQAPTPAPGGGNTDPGGGGGRRGNFDPAQMRQMMLERMKERMGASDDEWKVIQPRLEKVIELVPRPGGMGGFGRPPRQGDQGGQGQRGPGRGAGMFGGAPLPEAEALQKVVEDKASTNDQIKTAVKNYRDALEMREKELQKARQDLREVLSVRQEAQLVLLRILD